MQTLTRKSACVMLSLLLLLSAVLPVKAVSYTHLDVYKRQVHKHIRHDLGKRGAPHLDTHEQGVAHRRGDVADAKVIHEDQTELDGACLLYTSSLSQPGVSMMSGY